MIVLVQENKDGSSTGSGRTCGTDPRSNECDRERGVVTEGYNRMSLVAEARRRAGRGSGSTRRRGKEGQPEVKRRRAALKIRGIALR